jgi:hypothetical protein
MEPRRIVFNTRTSPDDSPQRHICANTLNSDDRVQFVFKVPVSKSDASSRESDSLHSHISCQWGQCHCSYSYSHSHSNSQYQRYRIDGRGG